MSNVRAFATLLVLVIVVLLAIFQMDLRGYEKVDRINEYVLYKETDYDCTILYGESYDLDCVEMYILKSGFYEIPLKEALEEELVTEEDLSAYIEYIE